METQYLIIFSTVSNFLVILVTLGISYKPLLYLIDIIATNSPNPPHKVYGELVVN